MVLQTLVLCKLGPIIVTITDLTLDHDLRTFTFDMLEQLSSRHMLEFLLVADITAKFRAIINCMSLKLFHGFPDEFSLFVILVASVRKFTKVNAVLKNTVNLFQEVWFSAIWADNCIPSCFVFLSYLI
jgi:hypothetical protein